MLPNGPMAHRLRMRKTQIDFAMLINQTGASNGNIMAPTTKRPVQSEIMVKTRSRHGYIAQWLERLTADQQVPGSNPGVSFFL